MWVESIHITCLASTTACEGTLTGTLWLGVGERECDFSEATKLQAVGPILEPWLAVNPAFLPLGHKSNCEHFVHSVTQKRDFICQ